MDEKGEKGQDRSRHDVGDAEDDRPFRAEIRAEQGVRCPRQAVDKQPGIRQHGRQSHADSAGQSGSLGSLHDAGFTREQ